MVQLDHRLLHDARRLMTGANVHRLKEMIFVYVRPFNFITATGRRIMSISRNMRYDFDAHHGGEDHLQKLEQAIKVAP